MYYLLLKSPKQIEAYKKEFDERRKSMDEGKSPVYNEMRGAKTALFECLPFNFISGVFMIAASLIVAKINIPEVVKVAVVMIINSFCYQIANMIFTVTKHHLRGRLCRLMKIPFDERAVAVMESLECQSV